MFFMIALPVYRRRVGIRTNIFASRQFHGNCDKFIIQICHSFVVYSLFELCCFVCGKSDWNLANVIRGRMVIFLFELICEYISIFSFSFIFVVGAIKLLDS
eukprot:Rmarinus@m.9351